MVFHYYDTYLAVLICENTNSENYSVSSETGSELMYMQNGSCIVNVIAEYFDRDL